MSDLRHPLIGFDTETTGTDPFDASIVTASIVHLDETGAVTREHNWLIDPGVPIPECASEVHGITDEVAQMNGEDPAIAIKEIVDTLYEYSQQGIPVVAFNAPFDFTLLLVEARRHDIQFHLPPVVIDPLVLDRGIDKYRAGPRTLQATCNLYGVDLKDAHDAASDAIAAVQLFWKLTERWSHLHDSILTNGYSSLMHLQRQWQAQWAEQFEDYLRRKNPEAVVERGWPIFDRAVAPAPTP